MTQQALVVYGGWDGHAPAEAVDLFVPFLRDHDFEVVVENSLEAYADASLMASTDLVVQCWTMGEILADELSGLRAAVSAGTGFAGWHGGIMDSFRMATDYLQLVGAQFAAHPGGIVDHTVTVVPERADDPIVEGITEFALRSEQYWLLTDNLNDVLATTSIVPGPDDSWHEPVVSPAVWKRGWGAGRVFVCAPGHQLADLELPPVRSIIERGMLWAARPAQ